MFPFIIPFPIQVLCRLFLPAESQVETARGAIYVSLRGCETNLPSSLFSRKVTVMPLLRAVLMVKGVWACHWNRLRKEQRMCRGQCAEQRLLTFPAPWFWLGSTGWNPLTLPVSSVGARCCVHGCASFPASFLDTYLNQMSALWVPQLASAGRGVNKQRGAVHVWIPASKGQELTRKWQQEQGFLCWDWREPGCEIPLQLLPRTDKSGPCELSR